MIAAVWLTPGGVILTILAALSLVSIALIVAKLRDLSGLFAGGEQREHILANLAAGTPVPPGSGHSPLDRLLAFASDAIATDMPEALMQRELERRGNAEVSRLERNVRALEIIATISPLLGLLGTVLGMLISFRALEFAGGSANASILAGGIWQALLTTAAGLVVAIPAAVAAALCSAQIERTAAAIEDLVARVLFSAEQARVPL